MLFFLFTIIVKLIAIFVLITMVGWIFWFLFWFFIVPILAIFSKKWENKRHDFFGNGGGIFPPFGL